MKNTLLLLLLLLVGMHAFSAQTDEELRQLRNRAAATKASANYLEVGDYYLLNTSPPYEHALTYLDSARWAAIKEKSVKNIGGYYSSLANYYYYQNSLPSFRKNKEKALALYQKVNAYADMATCYSDIGLYYNSIGKYEAERGYLRKGLLLMQEHSILNADYVVMLSNMGISYLYTGIYPEALKYAAEAHKHASLQKDTMMMIEALNTQGVIYRKQKRIDDCVDMYKKALHLCEAGNLLRRFPVLYMNISVVYSEYGRYQEAVFFANKSRETALKINDVRTLTRVYNIYQIALSAEKKYEAATDSIRKSLIYAKQTGNPGDCVQAYISMASLFSKMGKQDSTIFYLGEADKLTSVPGNEIQMDIHYENRGNIYMQLNQYDKALPVFHKLLNSYQRKNKQINPFDVYCCIGKCYGQTGEYKKAYSYMDSAYHSRSNVYNDDMQKQLSDLSIKYETKEKELKIAHLTQEQLKREALHMKHRNWSLIALILLVLIVGILMYRLQWQKLRNIRLSNKTKEEGQKFELLQKETEALLTRKYIDGLEGERTRLAKDLHDGVCNDLLSLEMLLSSTQTITEEFKSRFLSLLTTTRSSIRNISHELMPPAFQYSTIDEILHDYIWHLNQAISSSSLILSYDSSQSDDWSLVPSEISYELYRIVQESLNNALKHSGASQITISLSLEEHTLSLKITDNGTKAGMYPTKGKGIGLRIIQERVKSMNGQLEFIQTDEAAGFNICIQFNNA